MYELIPCPNCAGALVGDWNEVECSKCGQRYNTLDVAFPVVDRLSANPPAGFDTYVSRLSSAGVLKAVPVAYSGWSS